MLAARAEFGVGLNGHHIMSRAGMVFLMLQIARLNCVGFESVFSSQRFEFLEITLKMKSQSKPLITGFFCITTPFTNNYV
jgi:hypothetical protein